MCFIPLSDIIFSFATGRRRGCGQGDDAAPEPDRRRRRMVIRRLVSGLASVLLDLVQFPFRRRQKAARKERHEVTRIDFVDQLAATPAERQAADLLWDLLVETAVVEDFRPLPDDSLPKLYGLAEEDLDEDVILSIVQAMNLSPPSPASLHEIGTMETPRDVMRLIRAARYSKAR